MTVLVIVVATTLGISAFCSLLEATLYSTRVPTLEAARSQARLRAPADRFLILKREIASPTSAILILNTIANTAGATVAGMYAAESLGKGYVPLFSAVFTLAILMLSEILPKTFGATHWKRLWPFVATPLALLVRVLLPAVWVTRKFSAFFTGSSVTPAVTEDEIRASIRLGVKAGELSHHELKILDAVFRFDDKVVRQIMVPRDEVVFADLNEEPAEFFEVLRKTTFSRYPACRRSLDEVVGMLHVKDLSRIEPGEVDLPSLVRDIPSVPETLSIGQVMQQMQATQRQIAMVVDEFGTTSGIVTLTDILEQIVGAMDDEHDAEDAAIERRDDDTFAIRGNLSLDHINHELGLELYEPSVVTLSGLLVSKAGRLLRVGDVIDLEDGTAEVLEIRSNRATRILLTTSSTSQGRRPHAEGKDEEPA